MSSLNRRVHRAAATVVALAAGSTLVLTGAATADAGTGTSATSVPLVQGLYQSAYSERNDVLWATAAVGQPPAPVTASQLVKIDPRTLKVRATYAAPVDAAGSIEAAYGIDVDDEHNTVWVTNTRNNSVAVYSQKTGKHLATRPGVTHAREIVVDEERDLVWTTAFGDGTLVAYDSRTYKEIRRITVEGTGPTGLTVDERTGTVYAADFTNDRIIQVTRGSGTPRLIPTGDGPLSIALSANGRTAYTADQTTGTVSVVDLRSGRVTKSVPTGEGAKSVAADPCSGRVMVVNRLAGSVSVVDPRAGTVVETVSTDTYPNHVEMADGNTAFVLDKSGSGPAGEDRITRIRLGS